MFNFTTTTVINSLKDSTGKDLLVSTADSLQVKRVHTFKKENVSAVYKATAITPVMEKVTIPFNPTGVKPGDHCRLSLYVGLTQASQDSRYSNDMIYKGKLFSVEFIAKSTAAETLKALDKTIKKYQVLVYGEKLLNAEVSGSNLVITATSEFQRFKTVKIEKYNPDNTKYPYSGQFDVVWDLADNASALTKGVEGFGTYDYLLHNLRLPTFENTRAFGINQVEMPAIGALYNQYTIKYCVDRGSLGMHGVGDQVKSVTTHVFFVNQAVAPQFEAALANIEPTQAQSVSED